MKYLTFIRHSESYRDQPIPPALTEAMGKFAEKSFANGTLVETGGLGPSRDSTMISLRGGEPGITDGPFTEMREVIGGWAILESADEEEALKTAREFVDLHRKHWPGFDCECEVRPMAYTMCRPQTK